MVEGCSGPGELFQEDRDGGLVDSVHKGNQLIPGQADVAYIPNRRARGRLIHKSIFQFNRP